MHIITRLILGGAQENTLITCKELARRGHDVTLITGPAIGPEGELLAQTKGQAYETIVVDKMVRAIRPFADWQSYHAIKYHLRRIKPDIVHTHSAKAGILGRFAGYNLKNKWAPGKPKVVHTIHGLAFHRYQNELINRFYIAVEKAAAKRTDAIISVAEAMTEQALAVGVGKKENFTTAYSAIEEDDFLAGAGEQQCLDFRTQHDIAADAVVLVTIARLFELKGHKYIIESAKKLAKRFDNCVWLFVGDGILADSLKKAIAEAGLSSRFRFTGLLPASQMPLVLHSADILVHCSLREGLARVLPQAMLCGKCVVSFDVDGAKEVVNKNTGRLIEPENIEQLTQVCAELIENKDLRTQLGLAGRESVKTKFAPETMVDKIEEVYASFVE